MTAVARLSLPPHSIEAEQGVLGGLLLDNAAWDSIADAIAVGDFYRDDHRCIFRHIIQLIEAGQPADLLTVFEGIKASNEIERCGGLAYLGDIVKNTPSAANIRRYAEIVCEKALLRRMLEVSTRIGALVHEAGLTIDERMDSAGRLVDELIIGSIRQVDEHVLRDVLAQVIGVVQERYEAGGGLPGLSTGLADLDRLTGGLQRGELIIVAGRPGSGKTALAMGMAEHCARAGAVTLVGSFEMSDVQLGMRLISRSGRIGMHALRTGDLSEDEFHRLAGAVASLADVPIMLLEASAPTVQSMRAAAKRVKRAHKQIGLIVVDYLQLMAGHGDNRATEIADISRNLKRMAKEFDVPVIALSQLSREVERRPSKRPVMSDLRESGAIEADADLVLMLYRDEMYDDDSPYRGTAEIIIGKQRNGETGTIRVAYLAPFTRFENLASNWTLPFVKTKTRGLA